MVKKEELHLGQTVLVGTGRIGTVDGLTQTFAGIITKDGYEIWSYDDISAGQIFEDAYRETAHTKVDD